MFDKDIGYSSVARCTNLVSIYFNINKTLIFFYFYFYNDFYNNNVLININYYS
jgi:hypothetical protein